MENIQITLPDGKKMAMPKGCTAYDVAHKISPSLAKEAVSAGVDGKTVDLSRKLAHDCALKIYKPNMKEGLDTMRHSCAHVMAQAILRLFPDAKLTIGPVIEEGFYYDIAKKEPFTPDDLARIEAEMKRIVAENQPFERVEVSRDKALSLYPDNIYKREIVAELPEDEVVSVYHNRKTAASPASAAEFYDLCSGPHVPATGRVGAFKLLKVAGAYWRADASKDQLQRIYGTTFATQKELDEHLARLEQAAARDHRKLGREHSLIMFHEYAPGMPFLLENGMVIRMELENFLRAEQQARDYVEVKSPIIYNAKLWETSGHAKHYIHNMYYTDIDGQKYSVKPMNCPGHMLMFANSSKSYRELPLRLAEFGLVHRHELSGVLSGMFRVRAFTQDDTHIFCTEEQIESEVSGVIELIDKVLKTFGFEYTAELSTRPDDFMGELESWNRAEATLEAILKKKAIRYEINAGDGAFYGPKIDFKVKDAIGRVWQLSTVQLDFNMPQSFGLQYEGADGQRHTPIVIHRAVYGSFDRFMGILIEHYAAKFPVWLSPTQVALLPINDGMNGHARELAAKFKTAGIRAAVNEKTETIGAKIRTAQLEQVPYMLVIGQKEKESGALQVRQRDGKQFAASVDEFVALVRGKIAAKENV